MSEKGHQMDDASGELTLYVIPACHPSQAELEPGKRQEDIAFRLGGVWDCAGRPRHQWTMRVGPGVSLADRTMLKIRYASQSAKRLYDREMQNWKAPPSRTLTNNLSERFFNSDAPAFEPAEIGSQKRSYFFTSTDRDSPFYYKHFDRTVREHDLEVAVDHRIDFLGRRCWSYGLRYVLGNIPNELKGYRSRAARQAFFTSRREEFEALPALRVAAQLLYDRPVSGPLHTRYGTEKHSRALEKRPLFLPKKPGRQAFGTLERQIKARERAETAIAALPRVQLAELLEFTSDQVRQFSRFKERTLFEGNDIGSQEQAYLTRIQEGARFARDVLLSEGHEFALKPKSKPSPSAIVSAFQHGIVTDTMNEPDFIRCLPYLSDAEGGPQITIGRDVYGVYLDLPEGLLTIADKPGSQARVRTITSSLARESKDTTDAICVLTRILTDEEVRTFVHRAATLNDAILRINTDKELIEQQIRTSLKSNPELIPTILETVKLSTPPIKGIHVNDFLVFKVSLDSSDTIEENVCVSGPDGRAGILDFLPYNNARSFLEKKLSAGSIKETSSAVLSHRIINDEDVELEKSDPRLGRSSLVRYLRDTQLGRSETFGILFRDKERLIYNPFESLVEALDHLSRKTKTQRRRTTISLPSEQ